MIYSPSSALRSQVDTRLTGHQRSSRIDPMPQRSFQNLRGAEVGTGMPPNKLRKDNQLG
jgi:hypothetical protein